jgi:membrane peptidoglycan carboxypeptidase
VLDPITAYQITSMMEGVVKRGTATVVQEVGKPIAGKTGTTNDEKDAWFVASHPISSSACSSATTSRGRWARARPAASSQRPFSPSS